MMDRDYTNLPAAIREETLETLRQQIKTATDNATDHRISAQHHQGIADREAGYAERDEERARQWQAQLEFVERNAGVARPFRIGDQVIINDSELAYHGKDGFVECTDGRGVQVLLPKYGGNVDYRQWFLASQLTLIQGAPDAEEAFGGLGGVWEDPAVRQAVRETITEGGS